MREAPTLFMFEIEARAEIHPEPEKAQKDVVKQLNEKAVVICDKIEREVRKLFPPYVNVQADVHFESGSLLMTGTVAILSWLGNAALDALKEQAEEQLSALVKMAVLRVMKRTITEVGLTPSVGSMEMTVSPVRFVAPAPGASQQAATAAPSPPPSPSVVTSSPRAEPVSWLSWAVAVVFLLQVLLVLDRFVIVQLR